jgi:hypothetical protein
MRELILTWLLIFCLLAILTHSYMIQTACSTSQLSRIRDTLSTNTVTSIPLRSRRKTKITLMMLNSTSKMKEPFKMLKTKVTTKMKIKKSMKKTILKISTETSTTMKATTKMKITNHPAMVTAHKKTWLETSTNPLRLKS